VPYAVAGSSLPCQPCITLEQRNVLKQQLPKPVRTSVCLRRDGFYLSLIIWPVGRVDRSPFVPNTIFLPPTPPTPPKKQKQHIQVGDAVVKLWTLAVKGKGTLGDVVECLESQVAPAMDALHRRLDKKREKALVCACNV
jgi:hypothetical protein